jgi:hypothetical protein
MPEKGEIIRKGGKALENGEFKSQRLSLSGLYFTGKIPPLIHRVKVRAVVKRELKRPFFYVTCAEAERAADEQRGQDRDSGFGFWVWHFAVH